MIRDMGDHRHQVDREVAAVPVVGDSRSPNSLRDSINSSEMIVDRSSVFIV